MCTSTGRPSQETGVPRAIEIAHDPDGRIDDDEQVHVRLLGELVLRPRSERDDPHEALAELHMKVVFPALTVLWVLGMGLAGMSENAYDLKQTWLVLSLLNWALLMVISWKLIRPATTDPTAASRLSAGIGITHVGLVIGLVLMIWKPGQ